MAAPALHPQALQEGARAKPQKDLRVSDLEGAAMIGVACMFDATQGFITLIMLTPLLGLVFIPIPMLLTIGAFTTFGIWFGLKGVNYVGGRDAANKLLIVFAALVIDLIPYINALPAITGSVVLILMATRIEDTVGNKKLLDRRLRARNFWTGIASSGPVKTLTGGLADTMLAKEYGKGTQKMAAQVAYGRKEVTKEEAAGGIGSVQTQMRDIVRAAPNQNKDWQEDTRGSLKVGDRVHLTDTRYAAVRKEGIADRFPSREGTIVSMSAKGYAVQFGNAIRVVGANDIERVR